MLSAHWRQSPLVDALLDYTSQRLLGAIGLHFPASLGGYDLETVSSSLWKHCWSTLPSVLWGGVGLGGAIGLHFPASLGAMTWRQSLLPSGCTAGLHFPASLGAGAMRPCDNSTQSDASISDAGQPVCNLYCFPFSWLSGMHVIVEQSFMHTGP